MAVDSRNTSDRQTGPVPLNEWTDVRLVLQFAGKTTVALAIIAWIAWFSPFDDLLDRAGTPLAGDFVMFYVAGQVMADGNSGHLYDDQKNQHRACMLFPDMKATSSWPFRYPPTVAAIMSPLARLPFAAAVCLFVTTQMALLGLSVLLWRRELIGVASGAAWLGVCASTPVVVETLLGGQLSLLALTSVTLAVYCLHRDKPALAGMALAISLYKPNVLWLVVLAVCIARPRLLLGLLPTALIGLLATAAMCGWGPIINYGQLALSLGSSPWTLETPYWKVHGLTPLLQTLLPEQGRMASVIAGASIAMLLGGVWRWYRLDNHLMFGLLLTCNALFNPYVPIYDLVLLVPATLYLAVYAARVQLPIAPGQALWVLGGIFAGPHLSQMLSQSLGIQLFPLVLLAALAWYLRLAWNHRFATQQSKPDLAYRQTTQLT